MTICLLSSAHQAFDKRVFMKEARSLAQAGFRVISIVPHDGRLPPTDGVTFESYPPASGRLRRIWHCMRLLRIGMTITTDAYHCNELDSWAIGRILGWVRRAKVVFDVHEHYPGMVNARRFPAALVPLAVWIVRTYIHVLSRLTDLIVLSREGLREEYRRASRICVAANYAPLDGLQALEAGGPQDGNREEMLASGGFYAAAVGSFRRAAGWPELLESLTLVRYPEINLVVMGDILDGSREEFTARVKELGLTDRIKWLGWLPYSVMLRCLARCHVGLVLFQRWEMSHVHGFPHKMFDYMAAGIPVLVPSYAGEMCSIIEDCKAGLAIDASSPREIAQALEYLYEHPDERCQMGARGRDAVGRRYNWESEAKTLVQAYRELFSPFGLRDGR